MISVRVDGTEIMTNPVRILILAFCVVAVFAYFGDQLVLLGSQLAGSQKSTVRPPGNAPVYAPVYTKSNGSYYGGDVRIPMSRDGHYWVILEVNGAPVKFVVDTGASHISLSYKDAVAAGLNPSGLTYDRIFKTANGTSRKAIVTLDHISLESIELSNMSASVSQRGRMDISLLGMNFLNKLSGFTVENREMILKP
ncbi:MAG: TIGR02281 family clan AA aspartic protease [Alphaproteobacteria bacterium]|nr:MAG: TIGR02281 family clan AA aspartic protease [Alphaproteobacteria bacterium]